MDPQNKIRMLDTLSFIVAVVAIVGMAYILFSDNFQLFFNWRLILFLGAISLVSYFIIRKRQDIFAETL